MDNVIRQIYCDDCQRDINVEELPDGSVLIHCPRCVGECMVCECHLKEKCFRDVPGAKVKHEPA